MFADIVAMLIQQQFPGITILSPARQGLIYLDCTRNTRGQSIAAPYCVRPWPGATVSTPLKWSEVRRGLDPGRFTIKTLPARLEKVGDLWQPVMGAGIDPANCLERLSS